MSVLLSRLPDKYVNACMPTKLPLTGTSRPTTIDVPSTYSFLTGAIEVQPKTKHNKTKLKNFFIKILTWHYALLGFELSKSASSQINGHISIRKCKPDK